MDQVLFRSVKLNLLDVIAGVETDLTSELARIVVTQMDWVLFKFGKLKKNGFPG